MRQLSIFFAVLSLYLLSHIPIANALIETLQVTHDTRSAFHIESFGFESGGVFRMEVNNLERRVPDNTEAKDYYEIAFVLQRSSSDAPVRISSSATTSDEATQTIFEKVTTLPDRKDGDPVVTLKAFPILSQCFHRDSHGDDDIIIKLGSKSDWKHLKYEHLIQTPGFYHLYYSNCEPRTSVSWELKFEEFNINADGSHMYLSAGERYLPTMLVFLSLGFLVELCGWAWYLRTHSDNCKAIHWLMLVAVFIKMLSLMFEAMKYHSLKATGLHDGWFVAFYIISILKGMFLFCVIILLATGWSYLKPFLTERDKYILLGTIVVQALVNIMSVIVGEMQQGSSSWLTFHDLLAVLDAVCWCMILVPIAWSIRTLRAAATDDLRREEHGSTNRNIHRLQAFRSFYLLVLGFVYFTRIIVFLLRLTLPFEMMWLSTAFEESAALLFYGLTGFLFRPISNNPYSVLEGQEDEEEAEGLTDEQEGGDIQLQIAKHIELTNATQSPSPASADTTA